VNDAAAGSHSVGARRIALAARALVALVQLFPRGTALGIAGLEGRTYALLGGPRISVGRVNLRIAFPEWTESRRRSVLAESCANLARSFVELALLSREDPEELRRLVTIEGLEHLEKARQVSKTGGVIALTAHLGSWELLAAAMVAYGLPVTVVYRTRDNPLIEELLGSLRSRGGSELFARGSAARAGLRALREGRILTMLYDQNCRREEGVFVPFFGRLACARTGPPRIAMRTGAPVLPAFVEREGSSARHRVRILPALPILPAGGDPEAATRENARRMTQVIEEEIRRVPDHWIWGHRRWRTQPKGEPKPYPSRRHRS
jgi:KDO2-lipid IV(A) lauroyltransferase